MTAATTSKANPVVVPAKVKSPAARPVLSVLATIKDMLGLGRQAEQQAGGDEGNQHFHGHSGRSFFKRFPDLCEQRQSPSAKPRSRQSAAHRHHSRKFHTGGCSGDDPKPRAARML